MIAEPNVKTSRPGRRIAAGTRHASAAMMIHGSADQLAKSAPSTTINAATGMATIGATKNGSPLSGAIQVSRQGRAPASSLALGVKRPSRSSTPSASTNVAKMPQSGPRAIW
jgi:hypothetical protein